MKMQFDSKLLKHFDNIPRSVQQKNRSLQLINEKVHENPSKGKLNFLVASILTVLVFCMFFIISKPINENKQSSNEVKHPFSNVLETHEIEQTSLAKSKSSNSFSIIQTGGLMKEILVIKNDEQWRDNLKLVLNNVTSTKDTPTAAPVYDILVNMNDNVSIKLKLYIEEDSILLRDMGEENKYYKLDTKYAAAFEHALKNLPIIN